MRDALDELRGTIDEPLGASMGHRAVALGVAIVCGALLGLAAWLTPDISGVGTHTQLNFAPCLWTEHVGIPCPTCGMTTAFAHAAEGRIDRAFLAQPMGAILAVITAMTFWISLYIAITGSLIGRLLIGLWKPSVIWVLGGLTLLSWLYKIWSYTNMQEQSL